MINSTRYGFYLACSWLWCLGGFFPLILSRDYGWPALLAFTVFNVGGAIAMAFYFKSREQQQAFVQKHKQAISIFSYVTLAYQLFFIAWLGSLIGQNYIVLVVLSLAFVIYLAKNHITHWAIAIYGASIGLCLVFLQTDWTPVDHSIQSNWPHTLLPLAIGFIFSPFLDSTFHRAYRDSENPKVSFMFGFGVLFLSLIIFVFLYAGELSNLFFKQQIENSLLYPVFAFLVLQTAYTIAVHCQELSAEHNTRKATLGITIGSLTLLALGLLAIAKDTIIPWVNIPFAETIYKSFLFFYSLVFPLYLLLGKSRSAFIWVLALTTPAYSIGFLVGEEFTYALTAGVLIMFTSITFYKIKVKRLELKQAH